MKITRRQKKILKYLIKRHMRQSHFINCSERMCNLSINRGVAHVCGCMRGCDLPLCRSTRRLLHFCRNHIRQCSLLNTHLCHHCRIARMVQMAYHTFSRNPKYIHNI